MNRSLASAFLVAAAAATLGACSLTRPSPVKEMYLLEPPPLPAAAQTSPLSARIGKLARVVYHNKLGSQGERVDRLVKLAAAIAGRLGADAMQAERAALLAKALRQSGLAAAAFLAGFYLLLVGSKVAVALLAARWRNLLAGRTYRWVMRGLGAVLALFSLLLFREGLKHLGAI